MEQFWESLWSGFKKVWFLVVFIILDLLAVVFLNDWLEKTGISKAPSTYLIWLVIWTGLSGVIYYGLLHLLKERLAGLGGPTKTQEIVWGLFFMVIITMLMVQDWASLPAAVRFPALIYFGMASFLDLVRMM